MSVFRIPFCTHKIIISQSYALGNLDPPSKAGGIAVAIFSIIVAGLWYREDKGRYVRYI